MNEYIYFSFFGSRCFKVVLLCTLPFISRNFILIFIWIGNYLNLILFLMLNKLYFKMFWVLQTWFEIII